MAPPQDFANRFAASGHPDEAAFAATLRQYVSWWQ